MVCRAGLIAAAAAVVLVLVASVAEAQQRAAELQVFEFVALADDADAMWVNPAGLGVRAGSSFLSQTTIDFGGDFEHPRLRQGILGLRLGGLGLAYRHDRYASEQALVRRVGHTYTAGLALGDQAVSMGAARHWYRGGEREGSWDLGMLVRPVDWLSVGFGWRDLGSPLVGDIQLRDHLVAGLGLRPWGPAATLAAEMRYFGRDEGIEGYRAGVRWLTPRGVEAFFSVDMDDGARIEEYRAGLRFRFRRSNLDLMGRRPDAEPGGTRITLVNESFSRANPVPTFRPESRVAEVTVGGAHVDFPPPGFAIFDTDRPAMQPLLAAIRQARADPGVEALLVRLRPLATAFIGPVTALHQELRTELVGFRDAGKPVIVYMDSRAGPAELYVASAATEIVVPRLAQVAVLGVNFEIQRLRRTLERLHVAWDTIAAGEYKTTFQTLFTDSATAAQAAWIDGLVGGAFDELVLTLSDGRGLSPDSVRALADAGLLTAHAAREAGLIDHVGDRTVAEQRMRELVGRRSMERLEFVEPRQDRWGTPPTIAVVFAQGPIVTGRGGRDPIWGGVSMGAETVSRQLQRAAGLPGVRAIVLRVDSPGGSAVASDQILQAIERVRAEKKLPIMASMGNMAASGGYWISMKADTIVADPMTVTGSIGVISAIPVLEQLLDTLRVVNEQYTRGRFADIYTTSRSRTPEEMEQLRASTLHIYEVFLQETAAGRELPVDSVRALAGGRVWFGSDAREVGLVDELGGLHHAIELAAERTGIEEPYRVVVLRDPSRRFPAGLLGPLRLRLTPWLVGWLRDSWIQRDLSGNRVPER